MSLKFTCFLIAIAGLIGSGCNMVNPSETVPTYIRVDSFTVQSNDLFRTGSVSSEIKSVWVYFDNNVVGVYDLPANVPIITNGPGTVQLVPAVAFSGLSYVRQYPFYEPDTFSIPYKPGEATYHNGKTVYRTNARFQWKEDFDIGNSFIKVNSDKQEDVVLVRTEDKEYAFEGKGTGLIKMTTAQPSSEIITNRGFSITNGETYMELDYKCSVQFEIGIQTTLSNGQIIYKYIYGLNPTDTWKKAYIGFADFVAQYPNGQYNLMVRTKLQDDQTEGFVSLDNLKLISF